MAAQVLCNRRASYLARFLGKLPSDQLSGVRFCVLMSEFGALSKLR